VHPNHTYEKVVFDTWRQETWDVNDTVARTDPKTDPDIGGLFQRLPDSDYLPTWLTQRSGGGLGPAEQSAASKAVAHANTPTVAHFDALGRPILAVAYNRFIQSGSAVEAKYSTRTDLDIEGNQLSITDALHRTIMTSDYDLVKNSLHQNSVDAGARWVLSDLAKKPLRGWNERGFHTRYVYDALRRPTGLYVQQGNNPEILAESSVYGELLANPETQNLRSKIYQHYDETGVATNTSFDFKGNRTAGSRQLGIQYQKPVNWSPLAALRDPLQIATAASPLLQTEIFSSSSTFDALNRIVTATAQDGTVQHPVFNEANLLEQMSVNLRGATTATPFVTNIDYNAKGQRTLVEYGNGAKTTYAYAPETFRLTQLRTTRGVDNAVLQDLTYSYDPVGNITSIEDAAQQTIFFSNQAVNANAYYTYDAIYRLISASGREHIGQLSSPQTNWDDIPRMNRPLPTDGKAMRNYVENYSYDAVGNVRNIVHQAMNGNWTRTYAYDEPHTNPSNNRLTSTTVGALKDSYAYDPHGNMMKMQHLPRMSWDFKDQLASTQRQVLNNAQGETTYYLYDASGQRARKVTQSGAEKKTKERVYLGNYEIYREYASDGVSVTLERQTLAVMDDKRRVAMAETETTSGVATVLRYQFDNHLGSTSLELDANAATVSYEEYYPYGNTSYQAAPGALQVNLKRYRYIGKERDEESGFYYCGARYYAPWLARWTAADPIGVRGGKNLFAYVHNSPVILIDPNGTDPRKKPTPLPFVPPAIPDFRATASHETITYGGRSVDVYLFPGRSIPGKSTETLLIVGGVHQDEKNALKLSNELLAALQEQGDKPFYNIVFIPDLFHGRKIDPGTHGDIDKTPTNRNFPENDKSLADSVKNGRPKDQQGRNILPENVVLMATVEKFHPSASLSIHSHGPTRESEIDTKGAASITVDPKPGDEASADFIATEAALAANKAGVPTPGNRVDQTGGTARTRYPNDTAPAAPGVTFGNWGSHRGGMNQYLIETEGYTTPKGGTDNYSGWVPIVQQKLLADPADVAAANLARRLAPTIKALERSLGF
jgi:RHS repeat-associated protein